jgi:ubiquitin-associated SH3 domain-containing protein
MAAELIIYACPTGKLADQLDRFMAESQAKYGVNAAHRYMPHCTLTVFFRDALAAVPLYEQALGSIATHSPNSIIQVKGMTFRPDWHGLELESPWLVQQMHRLAREVSSPTRQPPLRVKEWLHVSLAYEFPPEQSAALEQLAGAIVQPNTLVDWDLRLYQRHGEGSWTCHWASPLPGNPPK